MYSFGFLIFLTTVVFFSAIGSAAWCGVNIVTGGPVYLSILISIISVITWACFAKMLSIIQQLTIMESIDEQR